MTDEAAAELKKSYLKLRLDEDGTHSRSSRTSVRQLESLVRLSEAYCRLKCASEVTVEHVRVAFNLLEKSMVRMDRADVILDEEDVSSIIPLFSCIPTLALFRRESMRTIRHRRELTRAFSRISPTKAREAARVLPETSPWRRAERSNREPRELAVHLS